MIALYLWDSGERDESDGQLARRIRDRVRRALAGDRLTAETLAWFIAAFDMTPEDESLLLATFAGRTPDDSGWSDTAVLPAPVVAQRHHTFALFDRYWVDGDGLRERQTSQAIMAMDDGLEGYFFEHDETIETIEVCRGGSLGREFRYGPGLVGHLLLFPAPLNRGQVAMLEYRSTYRRSETPIHEVRRIARNRSENIDLCVHFRRRPERVSWCVWTDNLAEVPVREAEVSLDRTGAAHRFLPYIRRTVVGFRWSMPAAW